MDVFQYNREAWNKRVSDKDQWTLPVSAEAIAKARDGDWSVVLTPTKPVPRNWFPPMTDLKVLCLASGGGQQAPIFAAAGADVVVLDASPAQLEQDRMVANRENLEIETVEGDMADLSCFVDEWFDLVFHPCSNCFVPDIKPVWAEAYRVLKWNGTLMSGFTNPISFAVDPTLEAKGIVQLKYKIPYSDLTSLTDEERKLYLDKGEAMAFGHTLQDQIGGQIEAGFAIAGFFEDSWPEALKTPLHKFFDAYIATRALKI